ncbi:MAG: indole-3-glycerol phosphate synthase TrpC [Candidatus Omnitrophota bacterium]
MNFLNKILKKKKEEIALLKKRFTLDELKRNLGKEKPLFKKAIAKKGLNIIAEVKKASPSKGIIIKDFNHKKIALVYKKLGAAAISVLTEKDFFKGNVGYLRDVKDISGLPVLRKDFIIDEYQIYESKLFSADAVLLITEILALDKLKKFIKIAKDVGLDVLVEVHTKRDLNKALKSGAEIIGINNRDLKTFKVDLCTTEKLIKFIPRDKIIISESGISTKKDLDYLRKLGVNVVLVGEAFLRAGFLKNIKKIIQ